MQVDVKLVEPVMPEAPLVRAFCLEEAESAVLTLAPGTVCRFEVRGRSPPPERQPRGASAAEQRADCALRISTYTAGRVLLQLRLSFLPSASATSCECTLRFYFCGGALHA